MSGFRGCQAAHPPHIPCDGSTKSGAHVARTILLLGTILASLHAANAQARANDAPGAFAVHLEYHVFFAGLRVARASAALTLAGGRYDLAFAGRSEGVFELLYGWRTIAETQGTTLAGTWRPKRHSFQRYRRGKVKGVLISYDGIGPPALIEIGPPGRFDDQRVPPAMRAGTIDYLSMAGTLISQATAGRSCEGHFQLFNGWRRFDAELTLAGVTAEGPVCRFVMHRKLAPGQVPEASISSAWADEEDGAVDNTSLREPASGTIAFAAAWLGGPIVPSVLKIDGWFGAASVRIVNACPGAWRIDTVQAALPPTCE